MMIKKELVQTILDGDIEPLKKLIHKNRARVLCHEYPVEGRDITVRAYVLNELKVEEDPETFKRFITIGGQYQIKPHEIGLSQIQVNDLYYTMEQAFELAEKEHKVKMYEDFIKGLVKSDKESNGEKPNKKE